MKNNIHILDCTLRDGGYVNEWKWGFLRARAIINNLVRAGIDVIEVGFLRNVNGYNENVTTCNRIEELNRLLPDRCGRSHFSAMAMCSNYDVIRLSPYNGQGIELVRITAHDYDIDEGFEFAEKIKTLGYKISINPINIMGYSTEQVLAIIKKANAIAPYQFSVVDTFGSMKLRDMERLVRIVDCELNPDIRLGVHLHENMSLGVALSQRFLDIKFQRDITVDASLMGIGRDPGNLPIELITDHINDNFGVTYKIEYLLDSIEDHISEMRGKSKWGYNTAYYLSARHNLHRNYSEYYLNKGDLTHRDINAIFENFSGNKKTAFDKEYAETLYIEYKSNNIDDTVDSEKLTAKLLGHKILILAPGATLTTHKNFILNYISKHKPIVVSVNFVPTDYDIDYAFFGNARRYQMSEGKLCKIITTSNFTAEKTDYRLNYIKLFNKNDKFVNSMLLFLRFIGSIGIKRVSLAGTDGFVKHKQNYFDEYLWSANQNIADINVYTSNLLHSTGVELNFITPSLYDKGEMNYGGTI
ncbi:MAG: aldolase catalytic domain-containing protein [Prevotellaceae bacterium]|jgi:4-hydroxy 2-oxovalerate aldolase|nr:aldolase catalytic domain-containing protein [Prevotellaceae bacterium]